MLLNVNYYHGSGQYKIHSIIIYNKSVFCLSVIKYKQYLKHFKMGYKSLWKEYEFINVKTIEISY